MKLWPGGAASGNVDAIKTCARSSDVFVRQAAVAGLVRASDTTEVKEHLAGSANGRMVVAQADRWTTGHATSGPVPAPVNRIREALGDDDPRVRWLGIRWAADTAATELKPLLKSQLEDAIDSAQMTSSMLAALDWLDGTDVKDPASRRRRLLAILKDGKAEELIATVLRMVDPADGSVVEHLSPFLDGERGERLQREAIRTMVAAARRGSVADRLTKLLDVVPNETAADALVALGGDSKNVSRLEAWKKKPDVAGREAQRQLDRLQGRAKYAHPSTENDLPAWLEAVGAGGDANAGWRVFFSKHARCSECHKYQGRGSELGPELTGIAARTSRADVLKSILHPSRDIAPMFVTTIVETNDGRTREGIHKTMNVT